MDESTPNSTLVKIANALKKINLLLLPATIAVSLVIYVFVAVETFIYVDDRPTGSRQLPKNTRKNWIARLMLLCGVALSLAMGYGVFYILEMVELARVKAVEYLVIAVPVQINIGLLIGTKMQLRLEKRMVRKQHITDVQGEPAGPTIDEKTALLNV